MYKRALPQALVGELPQGLGWRPLLDQLARAVGLTRWVSNQGVCRGVIALPGRDSGERAVDPTAGRHHRWTYGA